MDKGTLGIVLVGGSLAAMTWAIFLIGLWIDRKAKREKKERKIKKKREKLKHASA